MSQKGNLIKKHLIISLFSLLIFFVILYLSNSFAYDVFVHPERYFLFQTSLTPLDMQFRIVNVAVVILGILVSYIIYLILASKSRANLMVWNQTKDMASSREEFRWLYDAAPVPYVKLNDKGEIHEPNKATIRFLGMTEKELEGKDFSSFLPAEEKDHWDNLLQRYKSNVAINREEIQINSKNDGLRWVLLSIHETRNAIDGKRIGLASFFDTTDLKKLDQAKTEFVSLASHQLRTPLAAIKWYTDLILSPDLGTLNPKQKDYITKVNGVNEEMIALVDTLLNVSRIEIGSLAIEKKPTDIAKLCDGLLTELSNSIEKKKISITKNYSSSLSETETDPKLLRIVIHNLLTNAIKYTPESGKVTISFEESGGRKLIKVSDTGLGIPKNQHDKIFTKLFRADNVKNVSVGESTGLGLYLVKSIAEKLGGNISFESEENKGSTFTLSL